MQLLCILAAPHDKCRAWCRSSCSNGSFSCSHIYWGLLCSGNFGPLSSVHVRWMLCFCSSHFWHPVVTTPTVSLAMALMVSHLRKANGLVPFGAIWCLCCCTCGSLLAKVNWQNGSVYCSERLVKRPKKNQWFIAAVRISRGLHPCQWLPVSKAKNILKSHVANLSGCTHMGHMGWRQFLYMFFLCSFHDMRSCMGMGQT